MMSRMQSIISNFKSVVKIFSASIERKKVLTFLFFLTLSSVFWIILVLSNPIEGTVVVPVRYVGIPDSIFLKNDLPQQITVSMSDKGIALLRMAVYPDTVEVNVRNYIRTNNTLIKDEQLVQLLKSRLNKNAVIQKYSPTRISLDYELLQAKKVPVIFDGTVNTKTNFLLSGDIIVEPDSVLAYSSGTILSTLDIAYTVAEQFDNVDKDIRSNLKIKSLHRVKFVPDVVEVNIPVAEFAEKEFTVPIRCLNQPANINVIFFPSNVTVSFAVSLSQFNKILPEDFGIDLDYNELLSAKDRNIHLRLTKTPSSMIQNISISPSRVEFILEKNE